MGYGHLHTTQVHKHFGTRTQLLKTKSEMQSLHAALDGISLPIFPSASADTGLHDRDALLAPMFHL
jgi:hypothetical protein